jgi:AcrR family transcriptional regulator
MGRPRKITTVKPGQPVAKNGSHPTRDRLLQTTVELMADHLPQAITSEMVLQKSGISRGSLYHHFQDFSALLELAMVDAFALGVDKTIVSLSVLLDSAKCKEDLVKGLAIVTKSTQTRDLKQRRLHRARLISFTEDNPRLAAALSQEQQRLTDAIADLIRETQERGLLNKNFDPRSAAVLIQAYTLGKVVDDIVTNQMAEQAWEDLINLVVEKVFAA